MMKNRKNFFRVIFLKISLVKLRSSTFLLHGMWFTACGFHSSLHQSVSISAHIKAELAIEDSVVTMAQFSVQMISLLCFDGALL